MRIAPELVDEIVAHAREELPNECCGVVGGRDDQVTGVYPVTNTFASPMRFELDPKEQYEANKQIEARGDTMIGSFHSHTKSEAYPSQTDFNLWERWPELVHLICSLQDPAAPVVRAFAIREGAVEEVELEVEARA